MISSLSAKLKPRIKNPQTADARQRARALASDGNAEGAAPKEGTPADVEWHNSSADAVMKVLEASPAGLSANEVDRRLQRYGANRLPEPVKISAFMRFLQQFHNILIHVLLGCAAVTAFLGHWTDTSIILAVVIANAVIGFIQEGRAEKAMQAIRRMLAPRATVIREGKRLSIEGSQLVPGDIVLLEAGDKAPADLRLLATHSLSLQEAILTGESVPVMKSVEPVSRDAPLGERSCMVFSGTLVTHGQGMGVAVATGAATEIGRISGLLEDVEKLKTPLVVQIEIFAKRLTVLILTVSAALLIYGYFVAHYDFNEIFMAVVALAVAAIPEGLPAVLTIALAIGVQAMARRNAIVRRLPAIETLGSVSVICTDKTGTLTHNEMMIASVLTSEHFFTLEGNGYAPTGDLRLNDDPTPPSDHGTLEELARTAALCNDADLRNHGGVWVVEGDPMEGALLAFAGKMGIDIGGERNAWGRIDTIPFDAQHRFMATLNRNGKGNVIVFVKGAPERILAMCANQRQTTGGVESLDISNWTARADAIAAQGQRVLALAVGSIPTRRTALEHSDVAGALTLLGMVGMIDPPRTEAIKAVAECHDAGIRVKMITGDHAGTAAAIGKQIGVQNPHAVLTGADLDKMDDDALRQNVLDCDIFARTSPEHKLRLVVALQSRGVTVAMTGDGVNDAPALKRADAGIAMGKKGSEAAKEAAELVLADDNFTSIAAAVREGRTVYDNIKKVIGWTIPTSTGEAMIVIVALLFGMALPVTPIQILWVNLVTVITLGTALAFEPTEAGTMRRPPRPRDEALMSGPLIWHIVLVSALFLCGVFGIYHYALDQGYHIDLARTLALNTLVSMEIFHLFFIRNIYTSSFTRSAIRATNEIWIAVIVICGAQGAITYAPPLQNVFSTEALTIYQVLSVLGIGAALFCIVAIEKQIRLAALTLKSTRRSV